VNRLTFQRAALFAACAACCLAARAADWSDTSIGYRWGNKFAEPFEGDSIPKSIFDFQHASGYKYGTNFFNVDMLLSSSKDPSAPGSSAGAQETYVVYRHMLDLGKVTGKNLGWGPIRGYGITAGFDYNAKTDAGYNSKKRMPLLGPTVQMEVPGFLNISVLELWESNAPYNDFTQTATPRYSYKPHPMLSLAFGINFNVGPVPLAYEGFAVYIASKGTNEFGGPTAPETNWDSQLMYDLSPVFGAGPKTFRVGYEYQFWKNKFGNPASGPAGDGAYAKTNMIRLDYHF